MDLPKREKSLYFTHEGESGFKYEGTFTVKCRLNVGEKYLMELERSRLHAGTTPTNDLSGLAIVISTLRAKITDGPEWWKQGGGMGVDDQDALVALYSKVEELSDEWLKELKDKALKAKEAQPG